MRGLSLRPFDLLNEVKIFRLLLFCRCYPVCTIWVSILLWNSVIFWIISINNFLTPMLNIQCSVPLFWFHIQIANLYWCFFCLAYNSLTKEFRGLEIIFTKIVLLNLIFLPSKKIVYLTLRHPKRIAFWAEN